MKRFFNFLFLFSINLLIFQNPNVAQTVSAENFIKADRLKYNEYEISRQTKQVMMPETAAPVDVSYAVLKRGGKTIATFDGARSSFGNSTDFALFPLLGNKTKQLIVSQTVPRGGRHWVVDFSGGRAATVFDSADYTVGREDFVENDLNADGTFEIMLPLTAFYGFENYSIAETPLPEIVFEFDKKRGKYFPANPKFADYALRDIGERAAVITRTNRDSQFADVLDITLRYIFAGRELEAWSFYDREYNFADKETRKNKVLEILVREPVYRFVYRQKFVNENN
jgi:hypothetical protein